MLFKPLIASFTILSLLIPAIALSNPQKDANLIASLSKNKEKSTMNNQDVVEHLKSLVHYEIDHSFLLEQAVHNLTDSDVVKKIGSYRDEVEDNIKKFSSAIEKLGGEAPDHSRDFKGFFMQGYAALRGIASDHGVLQALDSNERLILDAYEKVLRLDLPQEAKEVVQKGYDKDKELFQTVQAQAEKLK